jgi:hypothetical protein
MIVVRVELLSAVTGRTTELARMHICNEGGDDNLGDYGVYVMRGRDASSLNRLWVDRRFARIGQVLRHPRLREHVWNLVGKALHATGYKHE